MDSTTLKRLSEREDEGAPAWIPQDKGDRIIGTVRRLGWGHDKEGARALVVTVEAVEVVVGGKEEPPGLRAIWCWADALRKGMAKARPEPEIGIKVSYFGKRRSGIGRDYHHYSIIVDREDEPFDWSEIAEDEDETGPRTDLPADPEPPKPSIDDEPPPF